ncbi:Hpt domain-containing protein [Xanthomonadaceae bacterium JHOS43]|nr:Hpt domain-containing protein [Xanthomonadaceae bacterium JHOS43]
MVGDDPDVLVEIVTHFEQVGESLRDELLHAARETDAAAASLLAHRLKSSARWVGALPLGTLCATLEEKSALAGPAELARQIAGVVKSMDETLMAMRLWREAQPALTPSPRGDDF